MDTQWTKPPHLPDLGNVVIKIWANHVGENWLLHTHTHSPYAYTQAALHNIPLRKLSCWKDSFCSEYLQLKMGAGRVVLRIWLNPFPPAAALQSISCFLGFLFTLQTSEQIGMWHLLETSKWLFNESFCKLLFPSASLGYTALSSRSEIQGNYQLHFPSLLCWPSLHFHREVWFSDSSSALLSIHPVQYTKMYFLS